MTGKAFCLLCLILLPWTLAAQEQETPPQDTSPSTAPTDSSPATGFVPPKLIKDAEAAYPDAALESRVSATVVVDLELDESGSVVSSSISAKSKQRVEGGLIGPLDPAMGFETSAIVAAAELEFSPAMDNGVPLSVQISYTFNFVLPEIVPQETERTTLPAAPAKEPVANFKGVLKERGTRKLLPGILVTLYEGDEGFEATTNEDGEFVFYDLEPNEWKILVDSPGYRKLLTKEALAKNEVVEASYYLQRESYNEYEVVIEGERVEKEVNRRTLKAADIVKVPGTLGDPVLVVENLPGVARPPSGTGALIVRGSGPQDTGVFINTINVPLIYHFGGLKSVIPATVIDDIEFYPGNYSVEYGRATGGIFNANLKKLEPDRIHGSFDISLLDTALYLEIPLGDTASIAVAGRRSYIDFILNAAIPDDADLAFDTAPRYWDYQVLFNWRPKPAHDFRLSLLGSDDILEIILDDPANDVGIGASSGNISFGTAFQRLIGEYNYVPNQKFNNKLRFSVGRDLIDASVFGEGRLLIDSLALQARNTAQYRLSENIRLALGVDALVGVTDGEVRFPRVPVEGGNGPEFTDFLFSEFENSISGSIAPFIEAELNFGPAKLVPGLRADYFLNTNQASVDPRIVGRYSLNKAWTLKGGVGLVHQEPTPQETDEVFGNPDLEIQRAIQYSLGTEWRPRDSSRIDGTVFYKDIDNLVANSDAFVDRDGEVVPEVLNNEGRGRVFGFEFFAEQKLTKKFRGWISYTLSRAERFDPGSDVARLFDFDQTHIFALVGSYLLPNNWEFGVRWRFVTGGLITPIVGGTFADFEDEFLPVRGPVNSSRLGPFHQLDLRIDKTWIYDSWRLSAYLSVINTYNRVNPEGLDYNFDFTESSVTGGLPILPILGIKGDW